ncbi:MAG: hypothetical protein HN337_03595 [Deltaproteobacteria bacterium]|jgi:hypothetical protein|nr:hypothetical protein [Deltaproteobacteria bacterium]
MPIKSEFKKYRILLFVLFVIIAACGGASPNTPSSIPISIEGVEGSTDISVDSTFTYEFSSAVDEDSLESDFFMVPTPSAGISASISAKASTTKVAIDTGICDIDNSIDATYTCDSDILCTLHPAKSLAYNANYTACVLSESFMATFQTEATDGDPSISLLLDSKGKAVDISGSTDVMSGSYTIVYSESMDDATAALAGNYVFSCLNEEFSPDSIDVIASGRVYRTNSDIDWYCQLNNTDLSISGVVSAGGVGIPTASYTYTVGCAISDDFQADSHSCYKIPDISAVTWTMWDDLLANVLTFDTANDALVYEQSSAVVAIYKDISIDASGFEVSFYGELISGVPDLDVQFMLVISDTMDLGTLMDGNALGKAMFIGFEYDSKNSKWICNNVYIEDDNVNHNKVDCSTADNGTFRINLSTSGASYQYSLDLGETYSDFPADPLFPVTITDFLDDFGENAYLVMLVSYEGTVEIQGDVQQIRALSGISSDTQY